MINVVACRLAGPPSRREHHVLLRSMDLFGGILACTWAQHHPFKVLTGECTRLSAHLSGSYGQIMVAVVACRLEGPPTRREHHVWLRPLGLSTAYSLLDRPSS